MAKNILFSNDEYLIRPSHNNDEFRRMWWRFMTVEGWNRGIYDLDTYMCPSVGSGMLLLIHKATDEPCGFISAVINHNKTGWVSMFIVDAAHRGKGMGSELFKCALADFDRMGTVIRGLDGVVQQKSTYERRGFVALPQSVLKLMVRPLVDKEPLAEAHREVIQCNRSNALPRY
jgi:GNAT superfamily N-acetyltransferase